MRRIVRKLPPRQRKFALALKHVLEDVPGPENLHREKIMKALKIKATVYYERRSEAEKTLFERLLVEGVRDCGEVPQR